MELYFLKLHDREIDEISNFSTYFEIILNSSIHLIYDDQLQHILLLYYNIFVIIDEKTRNKHL
ncbi:hypothetical protein RhiirB3_416032, partial [Rhizophagus irregularis]